MARRGSGAAVTAVEDVAVAVAVEVGDEAAERLGHLCQARRRGAVLDDEALRRHGLAQPLDLGVGRHEGHRGPPVDRRASPRRRPSGGPAPGLHVADLHAAALPVARAVPSAVPVAQVSMMSREAATLAAMSAPPGEAATAMTSERTPSGTSSTSSDQWPALRRATKPRASRWSVAVCVPGDPERAVGAHGDGARDGGRIGRPGEGLARPAAAVPVQQDGLVAVAALERAR